MLQLGRQAAALAPRPAEDAEGTQPQHPFRMLSPVTLLRSRSRVLAIRMDDQVEVKANGHAGLQGPSNNRRPRSCTVTASAGQLERAEAGAGARLPVGDRAYVKHAHPAERCEQLPT